MCHHVLDDPDLRVTCKKKSSPTVKFDPVSGKINIKSISQIYKEKLDIVPTNNNKKKQGMCHL